MKTNCIRFILSTLTLTVCLSATAKIVDHTGPYPDNMNEKQVDFLWAARLQCLAEQLDRFLDDRLEDLYQSQLQKNSLQNQILQSADKELKKRLFNDLQVTEKNLDVIGKSIRQTSYCMSLSQNPKTRIFQRYYPTGSVQEDFAWARQQTPCSMVKIQCHVRP